METDVGLTKVGMTWDLKKRLRQLNGSSPVPIRLFKAMECLGDHIAHLIELRCHDELTEEGFWDHDEWFKIDAKTAWEKVSSVSKDWFDKGRNTSEIVQGGYFRRRYAALKEIRKDKGQEKTPDPFVEKLKAMKCNANISTVKRHNRQKNEPCV